MKRHGKCIHCGWCCERRVYYEFPESYSEKKAKILAVNEDNTDRRFIKKITAWIECNGYMARRIVRIDVGCDFLKWRYKWGKRLSFCTVYGDRTKGCLYEKRMAYPENVNELPPEGMCGYYFTIEE